MDYYFFLLFGNGKLLWYFINFFIYSVIFFFFLADYHGDLELIYLHSAVWASQSLTSGVACFPLAFGPLPLDYQYFMQKLPWLSKCPSCCHSWHQVSSPPPFPLYYTSSIHSASQTQRTIKDVTVAHVQRAGWRDSVGCHWAEAAGP